MRKIFQSIEQVIGTVINITLLIILVIVFVTVFFYPEHAGEIYGKFLRGIDSMLNQ